MKLSEYIDINYKGNISAFSSSNKIAQPQAWLMVSKGAHYVFKGELYQLKRSLCDPTSYDKAKVMPASGGGE